MLFPEMSKAVVPFDAIIHSSIIYNQDFPWKEEKPLSPLFGEICPLYLPLFTNKNKIIYLNHFSPLFSILRFMINSLSDILNSFGVRYDVYNGDPVVYKDIRYEQACVLFNVGGLYSQLAANENRLSDEVNSSFLLHCKYAFYCLV